MKKLFRKTIAFFCFLILTVSLPISAFADDSIKNTIKSQEGSMATETAQEGPNVKDIVATGDSKTIELPKTENYFSDYQVMYVNAGEDVYVFAHKHPYKVENEARMPHVYHGARVVVLAEQSGYSCVLYYSDENVLHAAWIVTDYLDWEFPGQTDGIGSWERWQDTLVFGYSDPEVKWSKEWFVGSKQNFTILEEPVENCIGFTLDYQVIARNGATTNEVLGPRTVYVNDGEGWIEVGQFDYSALGPVHVLVSLDEVTTVKAVATVASCTKPDTFNFRQSLLTVFFAR